MSTDRPTVGIIYPDHAAEDEYPWAASLLDIDLPVVHIYGTDLHAVPQLLDLGSPERLAAGAEELARQQPDAVVWACTSGSFVYGPKGVENQISSLARVTGVPTSSTSAAFAAAIAHLGITKVAVAASYPQEVAELFLTYLDTCGARVVAMSSAGIETAAEVGTLTDEQVMDLAVAHDHPDAEALLVPDTAMHTLTVIPELESRLGKPVLTANQVTIWQGLRFTGVTPSSERLGALFAKAGA